MEPEKFVLWSTRAGGWLTPGAQYSSDLSEAERFTHEKAISRCKIHRGGMSQFGLVPVSEEDLKELAK